MKHPVIPKFRILFFFAVGIIGILIFAAVSHHHIASNVLRLHVIANSDITCDQLLKLQVRDRILKDYGDLFRTCQTAKEAEAVAENYRESILASAQDELLQYGCDTPVSVSVTPCKFPTKSYGGIRLPAGVYTALQVRIGAAEGHNWWCVLYPPLCLSQGSLSADPEALSKLRSHLTENEYNTLCSEDTISVRFQFKLLELLGKYFS